LAAAEKGRGFRHGVTNCLSVEWPLLWIVRPALIPCSSEARTRVLRSP
jgi:hypothetical protein